MVHISKRVLIAILVFFSSICNAQNSETCSAIEKTVMELKDSLKNVFVVEDIEPFSIPRYTELNDKFKNHVSNRILKKAYSLSKIKRSFTLNKCLAKDYLISSRAADSLRVLNKNMVGVDKDLSDSINKVLNAILAIEDKFERKIKHNNLLSSEPYKRLIAQTQKATSRIILIGQPIIVDDKYVFFTIFLGNESTDFFSSIYLYKKDGGKWILVKKDNW